MPLITRLVVLGATGDLAGRFLLPALAALHDAGRLPAGLTITGAAVERYDDDAFRRHAAERLERHALTASAGARDAVLRALRYVPIDLSDPATVARALAGPGPAAIYLALPARAFPAAVRAVEAAGWVPGSRIAIEKPFGRDVASAVELNALVSRVVGAEGESAVFRVDHVLAMPTVQDLVAMRASDPVLGAVWSGEHVERVEILWEETLALEGRASFYDRTGALADVVQSHVLQLLCLAAMEPPADVERDLADRRLDVLRSVRPLGGAAWVGCTRRARYTAGRLSAEGGASGGLVPDYVEEEGVDPARETETFAELELELDTPRWVGTRFVLRAGKALRARRKEIAVWFRGGAGAQLGEQGVLRFGIDGPEDITLAVASAAGPRTLIAPPRARTLPAYAHVLLDVLSGSRARSVRGAEAEAAWRVVEPVVEAWRSGRVPMETYAAGSDGPLPR